VQNAEQNAWNRLLGWNAQNGMLGIECPEWDAQCGSGSAYGGYNRMPVIQFHVPFV
jgi:hypothetical protein